MTAVAPAPSRSPAAPGSGRLGATGFGVRTPLGLALPALYHEDEFVQRLCEALDEVIAPVASTLDNLGAYLDPSLAPDDFVEWLSSWVGVSLDQTWPLARRRELVARAAQIYRHRGTPGSLADLVELDLGVRPEVIEGGGVSWSEAPDAPLPGRATTEVVVRVAVPDPDAVDRARLDRLVRTNKPAHLAHRVEVVQATRRASLPPPAPRGDPA